MIEEMFDKYYPKLYNDGAKVSCVNNNTHKPKNLVYYHNPRFKKDLVKYSSFKDINTYIEKYPNESAIDKIVIDFDGEDKGAVGKYVMEVSSYLKKLGLSHFIEDSTNKGYHLFLFLGKDYDFSISRRFSVNNRLFKSFVYRLLWKYTGYVDDVNIGMRTNIRMLGSRHPKTGKCVSPVIFKDYDYSFHKFVDDCYNYCLDSIPEIKYNGRWKKVVDYDKGFIDLRTLPWDNVTKANNNSIWCCCPWHDDSSPSLRVYEKSAYCMRCGKIPFSKVCDYFGIGD